MPQDYFSENHGRFSSHFHQIIALNQERGMLWEEAEKIAPLLPKGWFELSSLSQQDRIDFTLQFWISKLTFAASKGIFLEERLVQFFANMEDISIYLTQETSVSSFDVHMIYSLKEEIAFFHGSPPAHKETVGNLIKQFETITFPKDYLGFLEVHDGFSKYKDRGLIKTKEMAKTFLKFQEELYDEILLTADGIPIDPATLIPFYESDELHGYRCFYSDWVPEEEMGNVCYSVLAQKDVRSIFEEGPAYASFIAWLLDYLEERCTG